MKIIQTILISIVILIELIGLTIIITTDGLSQFGAHPAWGCKQRIKKSSNFVETEFVNPNAVSISFTMSDYLMMAKKWHFSSDARGPETEIPINKLTKDEFTEISSDDLLVTWLGHSTVLLEIDGYRILTDPVWSDRASPSSIFGPKRFHPMPLEVSQLPKIDAVIISHDHYDHLDALVVKELSKTGTLFITPLGIRAHLERWFIRPDRIVELDWWEEYQFGKELRLVCTPSQHFSGRNPFGKENQTLWSTWSILGLKQRVFFCGDTGESDLFKEIGKKYGPFDITLMQIGDYGEMWPEIHMTPKQAVQMHQDLNGQVMLPIHWGTFDCVYHKWNEPIEELSKLASELEFSLVAPRPGQRFNLDSLPALEYWWQDQNLKTNPNSHEMDLVVD